MIVPLLAVGALCWWLGRSSAPPTIGRALPASGPASQTSGVARFELGVPYAITATTRALSAAERARLYSLLTFGTYHARHVTWSRQGNGAERVSLTFVAPKTTHAPLGRPLDWDLGDGRVRLVLTSVRRLDHVRRLGGRSSV